MRGTDPVLTEPYSRARVAADATCLQAYAVMRAPTALAFPHNPSVNPVVAMTWSLMTIACQHNVSVRLAFPCSQATEAALPGCSTSAS